MRFQWLASFVPQPCDVLVDIGSGNGDLTAMFSAVATRVTGIDLDPANVRAAREQYKSVPGLDFVVADPRQSMPVGACDCVVAIFSAHHFLNEGVLARIKAHLRPHATVIILDIFADAKAPFWYHICDQLLFSTARNLVPVSKAVKNLGWSNTIEVWLFRVGWFLSATGRRHARTDIALGVPPTLRQWRTELGRTFPNGSLRMLPGSSLLFTWCNEV